MWKSARTGAGLDIDRPVVIVRPGPRQLTRSQQTVLAVWLQTGGGRGIGKLMGLGDHSYPYDAMKDLEREWDTKGTWQTLAFALDNELFRPHHLERE